MKGKYLHSPLGITKLAKFSLKANLTATNGKQTKQNKKSVMAWKNNKGDVECCQTFFLLTTTTNVNKLAINPKIEQIIAPAIAMPDDVSSIMIFVASVVFSDIVILLNCTIKKK